MSENLAMFTLSQYIINFLSGKVVFFIISFLFQKETDCRSFRMDMLLSDTAVRLLFFTFLGLVSLPSPHPELLFRLLFSEP